MIQKQPGDQHGLMEKIEEKRMPSGQCEETRRRPGKKGEPVPAGSEAVEKIAGKI